MKKYIIFIIIFLLLFSFTFIFANSNNNVLITSQKKYIILPVNNYLRYWTKWDMNSYYNDLNLSKTNFSIYSETINYDFNNSFETEYGNIYNYQLIQNYKQNKEKNPNGTELYTENEIDKFIFHFLVMENTLENSTIYVIKQQKITDLYKSCLKVFEQSTCLRIFRYYSKGLCND